MSGLTFSESEMKMLSRAWFCVDGGMPKIDYDKLATECGLAKSSANVLWNKVRRKLESANENGAAGGDGETAAATPKKTPKKRASKETPGTAEGSAKKRGRKSKAQVAAENALEEDGDGEEMNGGAKKRVKKEVVDGEEDGGVGKLLLGAKEYSKNGGDGLIEAGSDDEV